MRRRDFLQLSAIAGAHLLLGRRFCSAQSAENRASPSPGEELKANLVRTMKENGAWDVKVADPSQGFAHGIKDQNPLSLWPECKSVVVVGVPNTPYLDLIPEEDVEKLKRPPSPDRKAYTLNPLVGPVVSRAIPSGVRFLMQQGYRVKMNFPEKESLQYKMCAYESGMGIYGRSGLILHPELGNRIALGVFLTDAKLPADKKPANYLKCEDCGICVRSCPSRCYDPDKKYPDSYNLDKCARNKHRVLYSEHKVCQKCFSECPFAKRKDKELEDWLRQTAQNLASRSAPAQVPISGPAAWRLSQAEL